jgi:hypothetical protein
MRSWTGIVLARTATGGDGMRSRLSTYLHPLAGRPLVWHSLTALAAVRPAPDRLLMLGTDDLSPEMLVGLCPQLEVYGGGDGLPTVESERVLLLDAAAPAIGPRLGELLDAPDDARVVDGEGRTAAAVLDRDAALRLIADGGPGLAGLDAGGTAIPAQEAGTVVRDRCDLAAVARLVRDGIVRRLMADGATFLLPDTVLVDAEVRIGRDTVVYPGVVLEGQTSIGEETVIGPGCRIIDSWIGSGVELKGWNFISRSSVRNRAILEPYVRRGFE